MSKYPPETIAKIEALLREGTRQHIVAKELKVSKSFVCRVAAKAKLQGPSSRPALHSIAKMKRRAIELLAKGLKQREVVSQLGLEGIKLSQTTVSFIARKHRRAIRRTTARALSPEAIIDQAIERTTIVATAASEGKKSVLDVALQRLAKRPAQATVTLAPDVAAAISQVARINGIPFETMIDALLRVALEKK